jgi:hypothetical protein
VVERAVELRLWEALSADLLCPFHYFGIADGTQLADLQWKRGRYDERELEALYTGNDNRAGYRPGVKSKTNCRTCTR